MYAFGEIKEYVAPAIEMLRPKDAMPQRDKLLFPKPKKSKRKAWTRDEEATAKWMFASKKSFVRKDGHIFVYGQADHRLMRICIYANAGGLITFYEDGTCHTQPALCQACPKPHPLNWHEGHWMHPKSTGGRRCDGPCCGRFGCKPSHRKEHGRDF